MRTLWPRDSADIDIRLRLTGEVLRNMVVLGFRLPKARFDDLSILVQRPKSVAEQVRRVVFSFDLDKSVPALAKASLNFLCAIAAAEELKDVVRNFSRLAGTGGTRTLGKGPPCVTAFNVSSNHCKRTMSAIEAALEGYE